MSHALLSPSSAARWIACPPSALAESKYPDTTSDYAREGTLAHEICELKLSEKFLGRNVKTAMNRLKKDDLYEPEMEGYTDQYVDFVSKAYIAAESEPYLAAEKRLDMSEWIQGGFGTGDCILICGDTLHIIDFKYGKGVPVYPEGNPQMMLYALGAYSAYRILYPIKKVRMSIVQPRLGIFETAEMDLTDLLDWAEKTVKPAAELAVKGEGERCAGAHCRFCRAKAVCRARAEYNMQVEPAVEKDPNELTPEEIGDYLSRSKDVVAWANDLKEYALTACLEGKDIPGWKAVEGRSNRAWSDQDEAFNYIIDQGFAKKTKLYEKKPITLTAVEKLLGKTEFAQLADFIVKPPGKPALAEESDKRQAISNIITAKEAFAETEK